MNCFSKAAALLLLTLFAAAIFTNGRFSTIACGAGDRLAGKPQSLAQAATAHARRLRPRVALPIVLRDVMRILETKDSLARGPGAPPQAARMRPAFTRILLDDAHSRHVLNARCLDGSSPAYYVQRATAAVNASKFVVYLQGGGWCQQRNRLLA